MTRNPGTGAHTVPFESVMTRTPVTGDRRPATGDRRPATGDRGGSRAALGWRATPDAEGPLDPAGGGAPPDRRGVGERGRQEQTRRRHGHHSRSAGHLCCRPDRETRPRIGGV